MTKYEYKKRFEHTLKLSKRQMDQIEGHRLIDIFLDRSKLEDLHNINQEWINSLKYKKFYIYHMDEIKKNGIFDNGNVKIRKTKKGYVLEYIFRWRSKKIETEQYQCSECKKLKKLNWHYFCKGCTKKLGGSRGVNRKIDKELRKLRNNV